MSRVTPVDYEDAEIGERMAYGPREVTNPNSVVPMHSAPAMPFHGSPSRHASFYPASRNPAAGEPEKQTKGARLTAAWDYVSTVLLRMQRRIARTALAACRVHDAHAAKLVSQSIKSGALSCLYLAPLF